MVIYSKKRSYKSAKNSIHLFFLIKEFKMYSHCFPSNTQSTVIMKPCNICTCACAHMGQTLAQTLQPVQFFVQDRPTTK